MTFSVYSRLYIWVEGDDDDRFVKRILIPKFLSRYHHVQEPIKYSTQKHDKVEGYIKSIKSMGSEYVLFADIDSCGCCTEKKDKLILKYKTPEPQNIIIVRSEIESWYYAGISEETCEKLSVPVIANTDDLNKEMFNQIFQGNREPRVVTMNKILDNFSIQTAKQKNTSFNYFCDKFGI